MNDKQCDLTNS